MSHRQRIFIACASSVVVVALGRMCVDESPVFALTLLPGFLFDILVRERFDTSSLAGELNLFLPSVIIWSFLLYVAMSPARKSKQKDPTK